MYRVIAFVQNFVCSSPSMALIDGHYENKTLYEKTFGRYEEAEKFLKENYPNHVCTAMLGDFLSFRATGCCPNANVKVNMYNLCNRR